MTQVLHLSSRWNKCLISLLTSIQSIVFVSGRISPQFWEVFHKPTTSLFFSLFISQQLCPILHGRMFSKLICGRSWHFPSPFCYSNDLASILSSGGIVMLLFSLIMSNCQDHVLFVLIHLTGVLCFHSSSLILSSFASFLNRRAVWNLFLPLVPFFQ